MFRKILRVFFKILFFLLLIAIAVSLILFGLYYSKISQKQYIFGNMVDEVFDKAERIFVMDEEYLLGDTFSVDGTVKMQLSSEEYHKKGATDIEYKKKDRLLANLSAMDVQYHIQQDKKKELFYADFTENIGNEEIFSGKYYVENSTRYFFVNKILENYVNDGSNTYFESFKEEVTTPDNIEYLYHFIRDSIKNHITDEELSGYDVETYVGDEMVKAGQISFRVNDKSYKKLLKDVLNDLKKDERASQILSLMVPNVNDLKVNEKTKYLKSNESYTISVYVSKTFFQPIKYEVVYLKDDQKKIYTYEGNQKEGTFYYSENNEAKYHASCKFTNKNIDILVYDRKNQEVGTIKGQKDKNNLLLTLTLDLEDNRYDVSYSSKNKDFKDNTYTKEDILTFKIIEDKVIALQGNIENIATIQGSAKILEDVSSSVLRASLTEEESTKIDTLQDRIKERLEK